MPAAKTSTREPEPTAAVWLTGLPFALSLALVLVRATTLEVLRDAFDVAPGSDPVPRGVGAATSLVLDLVSWVPALLVLARGVFDRSFRLRFTWSHGFLAALAVWTVLSTLWASDKFAAVVSGFHWLSAAVFLWSASQLVRSWGRLRLVGGVCFALLLVYGAQALSSSYVEQPEMRKEWEQNRERHLRDHGMEPGTFAATSFEAKLLRGEMMGFGASPNTFAAVSVLLVVVTLGIVVQRVVDRTGVGWVILPLAGVALGGCIIVWTDSKTAYVTPLLAGGILATLAIANGWLARHARLAYATGVTLFLLGTAAVIGHGLHHGSLVIDSLTFRWRYWVGAAKVFADHPILGVGWDNFGLHYLAARLPTAAEEIRDPHNFLVRGFSELGAVGGLLLLAWMLRLWWELTRPALVPVLVSSSRRALPTLGILVVGAILLSIIATVDLSFFSVGGPVGPAYVTLRLLERGFAGLIILFGLWVAAVRSTTDSTLDDRPAPWLLYSMLAGLGVFFLHNLVDFSMFEVGPMFLFALLTGSALGMRRPDQTAASAPPTRWPFIALAGVVVLWLAATFALAVPLLLAEEGMKSGDNFLRTGQFERAAQEFRNAAETVPYNGDYAFRAAQVLQGGGPPDRVRQLLGDAVRANPAHAGYRATRAAFEARLPNPDVTRVRSDFDAALALDPANVPTRLQYAQILESLGLPTEARAQYESALRFNDQLAPDEVERLAPAKVAELNAAIARMKQ